MYIERKPLVYSPQIPWERASQIIEMTSANLLALPKLSDTSGLEKRFAAWLSSGHLTELRSITRDPLRAQLAGEARSMAVFAARPDGSEIIQFLLSTNGLSAPVLEQAVCIGTGRPGQIVRQDRQFTTEDRNGKSAEFLKPADLPEALDRIAEVWSSAPPKSEIILMAIWLLVAILNAHPFSNGNGRLARAVAVAFLVRNGALPHGTLPLGPLIYACDGNFEVAERRVAITGNWLPMINIFSVVVDFYRREFPAFVRDIGLCNNGLQLGMS